MNETTMTVRGNVVDAPTLRRTKNGHLVANFRVASTQRRFDREAGQWVDGTTLFVSVTAWRALADNVAASLLRGQPVMVHGRYYQRDYVKDDQPRTTYELEAVSVGHDMSRGTSEFRRNPRADVIQVETDESGAPLDVAASSYAELEGAEIVAGPGVTVDPDTGELHELAAV